jgi:hypothetical protein
MEPRHFRHWPPDLPRSLRAPSITLHEAFRGYSDYKREGRNLSHAL